MEPRSVSESALLMRLEFTYQFEDVSRAPVRSWQAYLPTPLGWVLVIGVALGISWLQAENDHSPDRLKTVGLWAFFYLLIMLVGQAFRMRGRFRQLAAFRRRWEAMPGDRGCIVDIHADGVVCRQREFRIDRGWHRFTHFRETDRAFILCRGGKRYLTIPFRAAAPDRLAELQALFLAKLPRGKSQDTRGFPVEPARPATGQAPGTVLEGVEGHETGELRSQ